MSETSLSSDAYGPEGAGSAATAPPGARSLSMILGLAKNSLFNLFGFILTAAVTFFLTPLMVHGLGKTVYGIWSVLVSLTGYFGLLDLGIRTAVVKYVSEYQAAKNHAAIARMNSVAWTLYAVIGVFSWVALTGLSFLIPQIFNLAGAPPINFTLLTAIIGADLFLTFFFIIFQGNIAGYQRYDILFRNSAVCQLFRAGMLAYFLTSGRGVVAVSTVVLAANLIGHCLNYISFKSLSRTANPALGVWDRDELARIWGYSRKSFAINIADRIFYNSDSIIIGIFLRPESVTFYVIASSLLVYLRQLVLAACGVFIPAASAAAGAGGLIEIHKIVVAGTRLVLFIVVPVCAVLLILGGDFIHLWMGPGFETSHRILWILTLGQFLSLSQYGLAMALYGLARHGLLARAHALIAALNIILCLILVKPFDLLGVAVASTISMSTFLLFLSPMLSALAMPLKSYFSAALLPSLILAAAYSGFLAAARHLIAPSTWFRFGYILFSSVVFYLFLSYIVLLSPRQKHNLLRLFGWRLSAAMSIFNRRRY